MKKRFAVLTAGICAAALLLTGCSGEISNDYITISQYKGVEVDKQASTKVSDDDVESEIEGVLQEHATSEDVTDRAAEDGDTVTIDFEGKKDGVAFDGGSASDYPLTLGSHSFIDGFEDGIIGHNIGEAFDLNLTFPEDYGSEELAGQDVVFTVTLKGISKQNVPELNDEFVQSVSKDSKTVEEYKKEVRESLEKTNKDNAKESLKEAAWSAVMENVEVTKYPKDQLQDASDRIREQYESMATYYGVEFDEFLSGYMNMDEDTFNTELAKAAKEQVKNELTRDLIADKAGIKLTKEMKQKKYEEYAANYGYESADALLDSVKENGDEEQLDKMILMDTVKEWLADNCKQVEKKDAATDSSK